ncbi:glutamyl-tRNA amidotransferase subunit A [Xylogone sp. PMI_703]|nr:glutamyl-tRNA amidotransferase subunit A [Xylogone sp. PMI_703]
MKDPSIRKEYLNYPEPRQGPNVPYIVKRKRNPALSGLTLLISAWLLETFEFVRAYIWRNTGFSGLRPIRKYLEVYEPRHDPTVIPIENPFVSSEDAPDSTSVEYLPGNPQAKYYSVADYHAMYLSGELTPLAVAKAILPLIRRDITPKGEHSVAWFDTKEEQVLAAAKASTLRYQRKCPLGRLDGVPTAVKDEYDMDGYKTCLGSANDYTYAADGSKSGVSWCVRKIDEAGMINLGKLSMHEFGLDTSGNNPVYGTPPNPYNPDYYTGGSSSGSAYAVAAGLVPVALGSDGGGSIRIPSSFCSVFGLKPTHHRVSHYPGMNYSNTCAVNGPLAADVQSLAVFFEVIGVPDPTSSFPPPTPFVYQPSRPKVLGVPEAWFSRSTPAIQQLCRSLITKLVEQKGYTVVPIEIPFLVEGQLAHAMTVLTDATTMLPVTKNLTAANKVMLALGTVTPASDYLLAQKLRTLLMQHLAYLWEEYPGMIIITPTTSCAGWQIKHRSAEMNYGVSDGDHTLKTMEYVWMANYLGLPAMSVPAGFVVPEGQKNAGEVASEDIKGKIPVGLMGCGEWCSEDTLLEWGFDAEELGTERQCRSPIWVDVIARAKKEMTRDAGGENNGH